MFFAISRSLSEISSHIIDSQKGANKLIYFPDQHHISRTFLFFKRGLRKLNTFFGASSHKENCSYIEAYL
ncbi:TPA: hypothetical protein DEG21_02595 [Patescibacteria group bacterium]|nr:hypothetical protein [Candidatus Gracilibacteria bacterium]HBY74764.1 hypothetical protein [Candidatus Gracilibacteria bacterium]